MSTITEKLKKCKMEGFYSRLGGARKLLAKEELFRSRSPDLGEGWQGSYQADNLTDVDQEIPV